VHGAIKVERDTGVKMKKRRLLSKNRENEGGGRGEFKSRRKKRRKGT